MLNAFRELGYEVDEVIGYASDRKKQILNIKNNILNGVKYDFMYSESSTMPTLLTEKHHLPLYPSLDFGFMEFCRKHSIKIGLFYRDMHWNFEHYKGNVPAFKRFFATLMYEYDLKKYKDLLDILYVPSMREEKYLRKYKLNNILSTLPPGADEVTLVKQKKLLTTLDEIRLIYVGGIGGVYELRNLLNVAPLFPKISFNICVRERDWVLVKDEYKKYFNNTNIHLHHVSVIELIDLLKKSDIAFTPLTNDEYYRMALPYKLFEYISYGLPVIGQKDTAVGDFIEENDCGWTINSDNEIVGLLQMLVDNPSVIVQKSEMAYDTALRNRWVSRAKKVIDDLS